MPGVPTEPDPVHAAASPDVPPRVLKRPRPGARAWMRTAARLLTAIILFVVALNAAARVIPLVAPVGLPARVPERPFLTDCVSAWRVC
ncbi:MAG: hypothetical protein HYX52_08055 [Chloroflexi bacterium]|nr:hypothetical protein [Chloroflexota bacterium]